MILVVDNFDSFTYNIIQYVGECGHEIEINQNNNINFDQIEKGRYTHVVISPGPGDPNSSGECINLIRNFYKKIPILGVCLGHQAIGVFFGFSLKKHKTICHGKISNITHSNNSVIYQNIPNIFKATRYHSLVISENKNINKSIIVNAWLEDGTIMGVEHEKHPIYGVQFHPESIQTKWGKRIIQNFINNCTIQ